MNALYKTILTLTILQGCSSAEIYTLKQDIAALEECGKEKRCSLDEREVLSDKVRVSFENAFPTETLAAIKQRGENAVQTLADASYLSEEDQKKFKSAVSSVNDLISCMGSVLAQTELVHYYVNKAGYDFVPGPEMIHEFQKNIQKSEKRHYLHEANKKQKITKQDMQFCKRKTWMKK